MKIQKKIKGVRGEEGGQGGCDRRIEIFGKICKKKKLCVCVWGGGGGVPVGGGSVL